MSDQLADLRHVRELICSLPFMAPDPDRVVAFVHEGQPVPKARPRLGKGGRVYTPSTTSQAEDDLAWLFRSAVANRPWMTNVSMFLIFYMEDRRRVDVDNLEKLAFDAATKAHVWRDDCQLTAHASLIEYDPERPRTVIALSPTTTSSLDRTVPAKKRRGALFS